MSDALTVARAIGPAGTCNRLVFAPGKAFSLAAVGSIRDRRMTRPTIGQTTRPPPYRGKRQRVHAPVSRVIGQISGRPALSASVIAGFRVV